MAHNFRKAFEIPVKKAIQWFPGHMGKGIRIMEHKIKSVDCVIEVHDARIPLSGRNRQLKTKILNLKPHILVLNKKDLIETNNYKVISSKIKESEGIEKVVFTNCKNHNCDGVRKILPIVKEMIINSKQNKTLDIEVKDNQTMMIIGVPNVGKSSLINALRNKYLKQKKVAAVGAVAGITRSVASKIKISENPPIYMIDTPGIMEPQICDDEVAMKLALCGCFLDHLVGEELIANYLLYWLNQNENFQYVELMGVENGPTDKIEEVLICGAIKLKKFRKLRNYEGRIVVMPDILYSAQHFIKQFRTGYFGKINLDQKEFN